MIATFFIYSSLIFITAIGGGLLPLLVPKEKEESLKLFVSFGAGVLMGMAFLHMLPEASHLAPETFGLWLLLGFLCLLILERFVMVHACEERGCDYHTIGVAAFGGLAVHGVIEGFALASSLFLSKLGPLILIGILAHKAPATFALSSILRLGAGSQRRVLGFVLGVAASVPAGMALALIFLRGESLTEWAGALLSCAAGTFLYIAACDLVPELHRTDRQKFNRLAAFLVGILFSALSGHLVEP